ncbi:hypothetical protein Tco_0681221, partial [Tanacetum coccineum]
CKVGQKSKHGSKYGHGMALCQDSMALSIAAQIALEDALVAPADRT